MKYPHWLPFHCTHKRRFPGIDHALVFFYKIPQLKLPSKCVQQPKSLGSSLSSVVWPLRDCPIGDRKSNGCDRSDFSLNQPSDSPDPTRNETLNAKDLKKVVSGPHTWDEEANSIDLGVWDCWSPYCWGQFFWWISKEGWFEGASIYGCAGFFFSPSSLHSKRKINMMTFEVV